MRANLTRIISLSVVIVGACGRSSKHGTSHLARLCLNPLSRDYWVPRLKRGMTTERFVAGLKLAPMGSSPRVTRGSLPRLAVINAVGPHIDRRRDPVGHVVEGCNRGDVPDVAIGKACAPQPLAVLLLDFPRCR